MVTNATKAMAGIIVTLLASSSMVAAVEIARQDEGWHVQGKSYKAVVDDQGSFRSLVIDGKEFLAQKEHEGVVKIGGDFPGESPAASVERGGDAIVATRDDITVRYTFDEEGFKQQSEGGTVRWLLSENVTACISTAGVIAPSGASGDVYRLVAGKAAVAIDEPQHVVRSVMFPSRLTRGGKPEEKFATRWTCGVHVAPEEQVNIAALDPAEGDPRVTAEYDAGQAPKLLLALRSFAGQPAPLTLAWTVHDHPHDGEQVDAGIERLTLAPGEEKQLELTVDVERPGLYWTRANILGGDANPGSGRGQLRQARTLAFIYDRDNYRPPLTRPEGFAAFWDDQLEKMRKIPFEPKLVRNDAYAIEGYTTYDLQINGQDGERLDCVLAVPQGAGPHDAEVSGFRGDPSGIKQSLTKASNQLVGVGMWQRGAPRVRLFAPLPKESTYRSWNGRDDNNMLCSYLRMVRLADYLRGRDDVRRLWLFGASRTGASMLAAAALAPERVAAVNVHVPTCCGISWSERPYRGWGQPPSRDAGGLKTAAYFDPVNFASDLTVPVVMDGGIYDGLAPAPGILAFYNHATDTPFRRCAIEQGPHGYFKASRRKEMEADLAEFLSERGVEP